MFGLRFIIIFFCWASLSSRALAAQYAIVSKEKSPVYADFALLFPVGILKKGQLIKIGDKFHRHGRLASVVIGGKIGFVELDNLKVEKRPGLPRNPRVAKEIRELLDKKDKKETPEPTSIYDQKEKLFLEQILAINYFTLTPQSMTVGGEEVEDTTLNETSGQFYYLEFKSWPYSKFGFLIGIEAFFLNTSLFNLSATGFKFGPLFRVLELLNFRLNLKAAVSLIPFAQIDLAGSNASFPTMAYGGNAGGELEYLFNSKWGLQAGADYYLISIPQKDYAYKGDLTATFSKTDLKGIRFYVGGIYSF